MVKKEVKTEFKEKKRTLKREYRVQKKAYRAEKKRLKKEYLESMHAYYEQEGTTEVLLAPKRSILEEIGNAVTHGLGAILSILAFLAMIFAADRASEYVAASIYFAGLFIMLLISCLYHSFPQGSTVKRVFRRFDYCCIYLLIGATFAPFLLCYLGGAYGITFFVVQWVIIALGVIMIAIFGPTRMRWLHYALYPLLGWSALLLIPPMLANHIGFFWYILLGGIIYSLGIIPFASKKASAHFIWHFFVLGGAAVFMFASIVISGINLITKEPLTGRNATIVAIALGLGFGLGSSTAAQAFMPQWLKYIFGGSGIVPAALIAILLNIIIPKDKAPEEAPKAEN